MNPNFTKIVHKLKTDNLTAISVYNPISFQHELKTSYGNEIVKKYGSIENFLEQLKNKNATELLIQEYRKNGSGIKKVNQPFTVFFSEKRENQLQPVATFPQPQQQSNFNQIPGLGYTDQINLFADQRDKIRLEQENEYLKKNEKFLSEEVAKLKEQILQDKYDLDKKSNNSQLIATLTETFAPMLQGFMSKSNAPSLNAPAVQLSEVKNYLLQSMQQGNFSDQMATVLINVYQKIENDPNFYTSLLEIMNKPKEEN